MNQHSLGHNYGWVVSTDQGYASRELTTEMHDVLACMAIAQESQMAKLSQALGFPIVIGVRLGVRSLHTRVYNLKDLEKGSDCLPSRMNGRDNLTYLQYNDAGGLVVVEGLLRERAQGHTPVLYADRRLSPNQVRVLDGLQAQISGRLHKSVGLPRAEVPTDTTEWEDNEPPAPSLEPVALHQ